MTGGPDVPGGYWHDTERQLAIGNHRDRLAARATNAHFTLHDAVPFGTPQASAATRAADHTGEDA